MLKYTIIFLNVIEHNNKKKRHSNNKHQNQCLKYPEGVSLQAMHLSIEQECCNF